MGQYQPTRKPLYWWSMPISYHDKLSVGIWMLKALFVWAVSLMAIAVLIAIAV